MADAGYQEMAFAGGRMLAAAEEGIGLVTFNQPEKRNAISLEMWDGLARILDAFAADATIRVVVLTGAGHQAFVSGADISQFDANRADAEAQRAYEQQTRAGRARLAGFPKPVIARIRGFCLGGGLAIAAMADLRIAARDSKFGIPAARLGLAYGQDMVRQLVSLVGPAHARMLLYTGARIDAVEAARIGLVNRVVEDGELSDVVLDLARGIADNAPLSIASAKATVAVAAGEEGAPDAETVARMATACFDSADYREGRRAFAEKRPPRFTGC